MLQQRKFTTEQARIQEQISDVQFMRDREIKKATARIEQKDQENLELMQQLF